MRVNKSNKTFQQGDLVGRKVDSMPDGEQKVLSKLRCVLAHGESGHSHVIESEDAELIQIGERMLLKLENESTLKHEEHHEITLSPGIWEIGRVKEYDYFARLERQVID